MRSPVLGAILAAVLMSTFAGAQTPADAGSVKQQLAEVERARKDLESVTDQLNAERARLEQEIEQAAARQRLMFTAGALGVLVVVVGGVVWFARRRRA
jgi:septal ring factor EnvC (AmiA/AmiB activator)